MLDYSTFEVLFNYNFTFDYTLVMGSSSFSPSLHDQKAIRSLQRPIQDNLRLPAQRLQNLKILLGVPNPIPQNNPNQSNSLFIPIPSLNPSLDSRAYPNNLLIPTIQNTTLQLKRTESHGDRSFNNS